MEYYSAIKRNEIELFVVRWMDLESVIQSEVSQKEKNKYHMLTHIYGILKKKVADTWPRGWYPCLRTPLHNRGVPREKIVASIHDGERTSSLPSLA